MTRVLRFRLAGMCWQAAGALMPFVEAAVMCRSLPRIVLARLGVRAVCLLMLTGRRLAPEAMQD
jgi:hypothetical protein